MPKLKTLLVTKPSTEIDHIATGAKAKTFRKSKCVEGKELGEAMGFGKCAGSRIVHLEKGRTQWNEDLDPNYIRNVYAIAKAKKKAIHKAKSVVA